MLHDDQTKENDMGWGCSMYGRDETAYKVLVENPEGGRPFRRLRRR
jgi:hypothetical protein